MGKRGAVEYQNPYAARTTRRGDPVPGEYGPVFWRPFPTSGPEPLQKGVFGDVLLNQVPAYYNQPQLHSGVEWRRTAYDTPSTYVGPPLSSNYQHTQRPTNIAGGQRWGMAFSGPLGPISAKKLAARVAAAQVRQSGLQATEWGQNLTGG